MNILFITPPPYLPNKLHRVRSYHLIKVLSKSHTVHLLCVATDKTKLSEFDEIKRICKTVTIVYLPRFQSFINILLYPHLPYEVAFSKNNYVKNIISKMISTKKINILYLKRLRSVVYVDPEIHKAPMIVDSTDAMSLFYSRLAKQSSVLRKMFYTLESIKYGLYEKYVSKVISKWIVCSDVDKDYLKKRINSSLFVIPNIIDFSYTPNKVANKKSKTPVLLFQGLMDKPVNIDAIQFFVTTIYPHVRKKHPTCKLFIVGPNPGREVKALQNKSIKVMGFVNDLTPVYNDATIVICPLITGTGTRNKILNAWKFKRPVISTSIGAEGLVTINGKNIIIADNPKKFAHEINHLLSDRKKQRLLAKEGFNTVKKYYTEKSLRTNLTKLLHDVKIT